MRLYQRPVRQEREEEISRIGQPHVYDGESPYCLSCVHYMCTSQQICSLLDVGLYCSLLCLTCLGRRPSQFSSICPSISVGQLRSLSHVSCVQSHPLCGLHSPDHMPRSQPHALRRLHSLHHVTCG